MIGILGAGSHGREIAAVIYGDDAVLLDDHLAGYMPVHRWFGEYVIGAAWPAVRQLIAIRAKGRPVDDTGIVRFPGSYQSPSALIGLHTHLGVNSVVSHGCVLGDFVQVCAGAVLGGEVTVGDGTFIGINASVIHGGITIGPHATIGAGTVILADVPAGATMVGVPAREVR